MTPRLVLDTNVLVAAAYAPSSASRQLVEAVLAREVMAVLSPAIRREYDYILQRAIQGSRYCVQLAEFLRAAKEVHPEVTPERISADPSDNKFLAAATADQADVIVTNDQHLLAVDPYEGVRILRPPAALRYIGHTRGTEETPGSGPS